MGHNGVGLDDMFCQTRLFSTIYHKTALFCKNWCLPTARIVIYPDVCLATLDMVKYRLASSWVPVQPLPLPEPPEQGGQRLEDCFLQTSLFESHHACLQLT